MELDHVFIFTTKPKQVASTLQEFGLRERTSNIHLGQGTACKRFFFHIIWNWPGWLMRRKLKALLLRKPNYGNGRNTTSLTIALLAFALEAQVI